MKHDIETSDAYVLYRIYNESLAMQDELWLYYCTCLIKLHHTLKKAEQTEILYYIKRILTPVLPLVIKHFENRFDVYKNLVDEEEKLEILQDIENSVVIFSEACDSLLQSINDSEWMQPPLIDAGVRYGVPKICAYYTDLLNYLADLFQDDNMLEYGFCVYPSLDSQPEAEVLFSSFKERGKVGVIRVPIKDVLDIKYLRKLLLHECFHIIPSLKIRNRKCRFAHYQKIIQSEISARLLEGVTAEPYIKERIGEYILESAYAEQKSKFVNIGADDRAYYSFTVMTVYANTYTNCIINALEKSSRDIFEFVYSEINFQDCYEYINKMSRVVEWHDAIKENIIHMLAENYIPKICRFHMNIFREVFADMLTLLILKITPQSWYSAFRYPNLNTEDIYINPEIYLRAALICKIMCEDSSIKLNKEVFEEWKEWTDSFQSKKSSDKFLEGLRQYLLAFDFIKESEENEQFMSCISMGENQAGIIVLFNKKEIWEEYIQYFYTCRQNFLMYESEHPEFDKYREKFLLQDDMSNTSILYTISKRHWEDVFVN